MNYQVLARRWRPRRFDDLVGQPLAQKLLVQSILKNKIAHAYLFSGTRGVGKTSVARILAKSLKCSERDHLIAKGDANPCLICEQCLSIDKNSHLDVVEMDGASNNSVENIRELVDTCVYLPSSGDYKIYIIDEVHMLSQSAFNALLKTLEEPPAHVVFILATTELKKIPLTILSRCVQIDFKNITDLDLETYISKVAKAENISFENPDLLKKISQLGNGSIRDSLTLLEQVIQVASSNHLTENDFVYSLGLVSSKNINLIWKYVLEGKQKDLITAFRETIDLNPDLKHFSMDLLRSFLNCIGTENYNQTLKQNYQLEENFSKTISYAEMLWIYESLSKDLQWSLSSLLPVNTFEISLIKVCLRRSFWISEKDIDLKTNNHSATVVPSAIIESIPKTIGSIVKPETQNLPHTVHQPNSQLNSPSNSKPNLKENLVPSWQSFIMFLFQKAPMLASNVERGNIIGHLSDLISEQQKIQLLFKEDDRIFYELLVEAENFKKVQNFFKEYFGEIVKAVNLELKVIKPQDAENVGFRNVAEEHGELAKKKEEISKDDLLNSPYVKQAKDLFKVEDNKIMVQLNKKSPR